MERVSVRICCGETAVSAVAPRAGMCCTHIERELQSSTLTYHRQLPAQFFHLLVLSNSFLYKGTAPLAMYTPYRWLKLFNLWAGKGHGRERERERLVLIYIFKCYGNTEIRIMNKIIIKLVHETHYLYIHIWFLFFFCYLPFFSEVFMRWKVICTKQFVTVTVRNKERALWAHILLFRLAVATITETKHQLRVFAASEDVVYALLVIVWWLKMALFQ